MLRKSSFVLWLSEVDKADIELVGSKGAKLAEMAQAGFPVANGFVVSSSAYFSFIRENKLADKIHGLLSTANLERADSLMQISAHIRKLIMQGRMSEELVKDIFFAYRKISGILRDSWVEVHSSPTDGIASSRSAGDSECKGEANLILRIKEGWASLFDPGVIIYRTEKNAGHFHSGIAMVVQKMVESDRSGVIFTVDPVTNDNTKIVIEAIYGVVGLLAGGHAAPDRIEVRKTDLVIVNKMIGKQTVLLKKVGLTNKEVRVSGKMAGKQKITHNQILDLALLGKKFEEFYYFPQEIVWAIEKNKIFIVRTRDSNKVNKRKPEDLQPSEKLQLLLKGVPASAGIAKGRVKIITSGWQVDKIDAGDVLVAVQVNSSYVRAMKRAGAVITDQGGRTSYCAIASREHGIPAIVGAGNATKILKDGSIVTVNGLLGEVYKGSALPRQQYIRTATRVYVNLSQSGLAAKVASKNVDGAGFLGAEFMKGEIGVHPQKLINDGKGNIYRERLAEQIGLFCRAFAPRPVIYRLSDFKVNEYRELEKGTEFETIEANPILGYRGSFRHIQDFEVFKLELEAVKIVRQQMGYKNLWMMVPFCRTVKELAEVKRIMTLSGLGRSPTFKLWMMVEVPSNVILLDKFIEEGIDGVSIGLNNLTMLLLGIDRSNSEVSRAFDTGNPAVLWAIERTIKTCHKYGVSSSICSQSASLSPDLLEKLVEWGISSVSVAPDVIESSREKIFDIERRLIEKRHHGKN